MSRRSELKCCQLRYSRVPPIQLQYDNKKGRPHESGGPKRSWGGRTRTCNFRINSPAVCQLTYTPMHNGPKQNTSISRTIVDSVAIEPFKETLLELLVAGLNIETSRRSELRSWQLCYSRLPPIQLQYDKKKSRSEI